MTDSGDGPTDDADAPADDAAPRTDRAEAPAGDAEAPAGDAEAPAGDADASTVAPDDAATATLTESGTDLQAVDGATAFDGDERFAPAGPALYTVVGTTFDATVAVGATRCELVCALPTLDSVVVDETVPEVLAAGWFETFERRLDGIDGAVGAGPVEAVAVTRSGDSVLVEVTVAGDAPADAVRAAVTFVEGTWFQGIVPGYEYAEPVRSAREAARARGGS